MVDMSRRSVLRSAAASTGGLAAASVISVGALAQNQPSTASPNTASLQSFDNTGALADYEYPLGIQPLKTYEGCSAREVTVEEF
jgi:hypothetical protein